MGDKIVKSTRVQSIKTPSGLSRSESDTKATQSSPIKDAGAKAKDRVEQALASPQSSRRDSLIGSPRDERRDPVVLSEQLGSNLPSADALSPKSATGTAQYQRKRKYVRSLTPQMLETVRSREHDRNRPQPNTFEAPQTSVQHSTPKDTGRLKRNLNHVFGEPTQRKAIVKTKLSDQLKDIPKVVDSPLEHQEISTAAEIERVDLRAAMVNESLADLKTSVQKVLAGWVAEEKETGESEQLNIFDSFLWWDAEHMKEQVVFITRLLSLGSAIDGYDVGGKDALFSAVYFLWSCRTDPSPEVKLDKFPGTAQELLDNVRLFFTEVGNNLNIDAAGKENREVSAESSFQHDEITKSTLKTLKVLNQLDKKIDDDEWNDFDFNG